MQKRLSGGGDAFGCIFIGTGDEQLLIACTPIEAESGGLTVRVSVSCAAAFLEGGDEAGEGGGEVIVTFLFSVISPMVVASPELSFFVAFTA